MTSTEIQPSEPLSPQPETLRCAQCLQVFPREALWTVEDRAFCEPCLRDLGDKVRLFYRELGNNANIPGALLWGTAAASAGALAWYLVTVQTGIQLGILAVGVAWLVGKAVIRGSGHRRGPVLQAMSVSLTLGAILLAELTMAAQATKPETPPLDQLFLHWAQSLGVIGVVIIGFAVYQAWLMLRLPKVS
jgi:hypothetical protein